MSTSDIKGNKFDYAILKRLVSFIKPYKGKFFLLFAVTILGALLAPLSPILIGTIIDDHLAVRQYEGVTTFFIVLIVILVFQAVVQFANTYLSGWLGQTVIRDIRIDLYKHILKLKLKFYDTTPIGQLVTRCISDIETLAEVFSQGLAALAAEILQLIAIIVVMFYINWQLTLITLSVFPFLIFSTYVFKEKIKASYNEVRNAVAKLNTFVQEHVTGMSIVQIFNSEQREFNKFKDINFQHRKSNLKSVKYYSIYFPVAEVLGAIGTGLIVWYGGKNSIGGYVKGPGELVQFIMFLGMFFRPIRMIADRFNTLQMGIISTERIIRLLDSKEHISDEGELEISSLEGVIEFKDVHFSYNEGEEVLHGISFRVEKGQSLAIVGATGAGKSSIINLLNRYYEINAGTVTIDSTNIKEFRLDSLRENIGVVLQDVFLFSGSVRDNISLGNTSITDQQIWEAAEAVGAKKFIELLPQKLDYDVRERGASLSVGQRQLLSFVRAMVYQPKVLVLDEATSSVDSETEHLIQEAIERIMKGRTSIVIAHRLSTIQKADKILVLDKGNVVEEGNHEELLKKEGYYKQLYDMQLTHA